MGPRHQLRYRDDCVLAVPGRTAPGLLMAVSYQYLFCDLLTDQVICYLPLTNVSFERRIIQAGTFRATLPVPNAAMAALARKIAPTGADEIASGPGRTVCHVYRNGQIWGTYLIW